jgi:hypothetical protein
MPTLINMQMSAEEAKETMEPKAADAPKYPWGLCITLNDETLAKLGITDLPKVGTVITIVAKAEVSSIRDYQTQGGESEASMDLQITDMAVSADSAITDALYDKK